MTTINKNQVRRTMTPPPSISHQYHSFLMPSFNNETPLYFLPSGSPPDSYLHLRLLFSRLLRPFKYFLTYLFRHLEGTAIFTRDFVSQNQHRYGAEDSRKCKVPPGAE